MPTGALILHKSLHQEDSKHLLDIKLTAIPFIKPGLMDPNWKGNALDASAGAYNNIQITLTNQM